MGALGPRKGMRARVDLRPYAADEIRCQLYTLICLDCVLLRLQSRQYFVQLRPRRLQSRKDFLQERPRGRQSRQHFVQLRPRRLQSLQDFGHTRHVGRNRDNILSRSIRRAAIATRFWAVASASGAIVTRFWAHASPRPQSRQDFVEERPRRL